MRDDDDSRDEVRGETGAKRRRGEARRADRYRPEIRQRNGQNKTWWRYEDREDETRGRWGYDGRGYERGDERGSMRGRRSPFSAYARWEGDPRR